MISKQQQKYIHSLHNKKYRTEYRQFIVEGEKSLDELLQSDYEIKQLYITEKYTLNRIINHDFTICSEDIIRKISTFKSNNAGIAVVDQVKNTPPVNTEPLTLILDEINDPGNLGTIIRLADWYGLRNIVCSKNTVEFYNPKVIASSMGSFTRIRPYYTDLDIFLAQYKHPVYGADLDGNNVHHQKFEDSFAMIIGSESHGISSNIQPYLTNKITIPRIGQAESLNAAMATAIILDNIFRKS